METPRLHRRARKFLGEVRVAVVKGKMKGPAFDRLPRLLDAPNIGSRPH